MGKGYGIKEKPTANGVGLHLSKGKDRKYWGSPWQAEIQ